MALPQPARVSAPVIVACLLMIHPAVGEVPPPSAPDPQLVERWLVRVASQGLLPESEAPEPDHEPPVSARLSAGDERPPLPASTGTLKSLTLLLEFSDVRARVSPSVMHSKIYGAGGGDFPFESVALYYQRSSYGKLTYIGDTLGWYRLSGTQASYRPAQSEAADHAVQRMVTEALDYYRSPAGGSINFAPYDTDADGFIDAINVVHAGRAYVPTCTFRSGFVGWFPASSYTVSGKKLGRYAYVNEDSSGLGSAEGVFLTRTLIHEIGHLLGLPDYYDYSAFSDDGPLGGIKHDMMGDSQGDHNVFTKWLLGWLSPVIVRSGMDQYQLRASSGTSDSETAYAVFPGHTGSKFSQFFLIENAHRVGNRSPYGNANFPDMLSDGLLVWHVDATQDTTGSTFKYNNSYTSRKLIRMAQADGQEDIEYNRWPDAGDFWGEGAVFSTATFPNSNSYEGSVTGVTVRDISRAGAVMTARIGIETTPWTTPVILGPAEASGVRNAVFFYPIRALNAPTSYGASPLPAGLRIDSKTGAILGVPQSEGASTVTITASNPAGSSSMQLRLVITSQLPPGISAPVLQARSVMAVVNKPFRYVLLATSGPTRFRVYSPLPPGLRLDQDRGVISGTPTQTGTYFFDVAAWNDAGFDYSRLTLLVVSAEPVMTLTPPAAEVSSAGGTGSVTVESNSQFAVASQAFWLAVSLPNMLLPAGRHNIGYQVAPNATGVRREGVLLIGTLSFTVTQASPEARPVITPRGIVDPWNYTEGLAPGAWVSIYGQELAGSAKEWSPVQGQPVATVLNGVSVKFNGKPAMLSYVSPGQINALVPLDLPTGPVQVVVEKDGRASDPMTTEARPILPAVYAIPDVGYPQPRLSITAVNPVTGELLNKTYADNRARRGARPGELIDVYCVGLGMVSPLPPLSTLFAGYYPLVQRPTVVLEAAAVGARRLEPLAAGLASPGLYIVRFVVPNDFLRDDYRLKLSFPSGDSASFVYLYVSP